jgi:putative protease
MMNLELLAPAGSPEALMAAVQSGANAVYLGYGAFHARRNAKNFSKEDFSAAVSYCRLRGVKVYLTLNTLVTDRELPKAAETAVFAVQCGIDAILVQDLGVSHMLHEMIPEVSLHASTQMTIHNLPGILFCQSLGLSRVVLSRELSRDAIAYLCQHSPLEIEVFVHGALCMGYSGQCFFSSLVGGRSGNRGLCAQPCRLAYRWEETASPSFPLSLKDLSLAGQLQDLASMGVSCLKLEGRMKRPEYVAIVTKIYADSLREKREPTKQEEKQLAVAFSRDGFTQGYYLEEKGSIMFGRRKEADTPPQKLFAETRERYTRLERALVPIVISVEIQTGLPVTITASDRDGNQGTATGAVPEPAHTRALTQEQVEAQLSKTGGTVFFCETVDVHLDPGLSLPLSALNALRRGALEALSDLRSSPP